MATALSAVLVTHNSEDGIDATISQLESSLRHLSAEIIAVDNASQDDTVRLLQRRIRRGRVVELTQNIGYGPGLNVGLAMAEGRRVLLMNDDVRFDADCVNRLIDTLDSSRDIGIVGPRIVHTDGRPAPAARPYLPGWKDEWARVIDVVTRHDSRTDYPAAGDPLDVGLLIAACLMGRTEVLRSIGGFNESFFFFGEDIDLCRRLHKTGYRCVLAPAATAIHHSEMAADRRYQGKAFSIRALKARDMVLPDLVVPAVEDAAQLLSGDRAQRPAAQADVPPSARALRRTEHQEPPPTDAAGVLRSAYGPSTISRWSVLISLRTVREPSGNAAVTSTTASLPNPKCAIGAWPLAKPSPVPIS